MCRRSLARDVCAEARRAGLHACRRQVDDLTESQVAHPGNEFEDELHRAEVVELHGALIVMDSV